MTRTKKWGFGHQGLSCPFWDFCTDWTEVKANWQQWQQWSGSKRADIAVGVPGSKRISEIQRQGPGTGGFPQQFTGTSRTLSGILLFHTVVLSVTCNIILKATDYCSRSLRIESHSPGFEFWFCSHWLYDLTEAMVSSDSWWDLSEILPWVNQVFQAKPKLHNPKVMDTLLLVLFWFSNPGDWTQGLYIKLCSQLF